MIPSRSNAFAVPTVSAIIERLHDSQTQILLQTRLSAPGTSRDEPEYHGTWELPQGKIEAFENIYQALEREVLEETGLQITKTRPDTKTQIYSPKNDSAFGFTSFCCVQQLKTTSGRPWIGFVFVCQVEDQEPIATEESGEFKWFDKEELEKLVTQAPEKVFTYNLPALEYYLNYNQS